MTKSKGLTPCERAAGEDGGEMVSTAGADGLEGELDFAAEDVSVQEEESGEGLVLGGGGDVEVYGEVSEEGFDFGGAHEGRMALLVEEDEAAYPVEVGGLRAERVVLTAEGEAQAIEKAGWVVGHDVPLVDGGGEVL